MKTTAEARDAPPTMSGGGMPRLPIAPEQPPIDEDERFLYPAPSVDVRTPDEAPRLERLLEDWMCRLERRLDQMAERLPPMQQQRLSKRPESPSAKEPACTTTTPLLLPAPKPLSPTTQAKVGAAPANSLPSNSPTASNECSRSGAERKDAAMGSRSVDPPPPHRGRSLGRWLRKQKDRTKAMAPKRVGTAERISEHWAALEKHESPQRGLIYWIVSHKWFDCLITAVVLFSAVMVGVQIDYEMRNPDVVTTFFDNTEFTCSAIFTVEMAMRLYALGLSTLCGPNERGLFIAEVILVLFSWIEISFRIIYEVAGINTDMGVSKVSKMFAIGRLMRIIRTIRLFSELRVMANMIWSSFRSLLWLFFILVALGYCFALVLTQGAALYMDRTQGDGGVERARLLEAYGSVLATMYSLFKCMTGGRNWGEVAEIIEPAGWAYSGLVVLYVFINLFSVLNIVTGVFVDGAIELRNRDRSMMIQKQGQRREAFAEHLVHLLRDMDCSGDGAITRDEFLSSFSRPDVKQFMSALSIELDDAHNMFTLLDRNMDGTVDIVEFVMGMERLRGEAKSSDIHFLIMQCQHIIDILKHLTGRAPEPPSWLSSGSKERRLSKTRMSYRGLPGDPGSDFNARCSNAGRPSIFHAGSADSRWRPSFASVQ